jgi:hypothetical protein
MEIFVMLKMKALKTFLGRPGEGQGVDRAVRKGTEFTVATEQRMVELEKIGCAQRLKGRPVRAAAPKANTAAGAGPLSGAGGKTGEAGSQSSSLPGLQPSVRVKRSRKRRGAKAGPGRG